MKDATKSSLEAIRTAIDSAVRRLSREDYKEFLEELGSDIDGRLDAVNEEMSNDE